MKKIFATFLLVVILILVAKATDIIPIKSWPTVVNLNGKTFYNPNIKICVMAGYRMLTPKPNTPVGKRIKSQKIIQDPEDVTKYKYDIVYEDIPEPTPTPVPVPEVLTNVLPDRVMFRFTTNGYYRGVTWLDTPATNVVKK